MNLELFPQNRFLETELLDQGGILKTPIHIVKLFSKMFFPNIFHHKKVTLKSVSSKTQSLEKDLQKGET